MLGVVLPAVRRGEGRLAQHGLEPVHLHQEGELGPQPLLQTVGQGRLVHEQVPAFITHRLIVARAATGPYHRAKLEMV